VFPDDIKICRARSVLMMICVCELRSKYVTHTANDECWWCSQAARDKYRELEPAGMHCALVFQFIESQALILSPICPHVTEHIWQLIGKVSPSALARWLINADIVLQCNQ